MGISAKVARRFIATLDVEQAAEGIFDGILPDGSGREDPPSTRIYFLGQNEWRGNKVEKPLPDGSFRITVRAQLSIVAEDSILKKFFEAFPDGEKALDKAFRGRLKKIVKDNMPDLLRDALRKPNGFVYYSALTNIYGYGADDEFEDAKNFKVSRIDLAENIRTDIGKFALQAVRPATFSFEIRRKAQVVDTPLKGMSDKDLNDLIWDAIGPEGVLMDGLVSESALPGRMRALREEYRGLSPRKQVELWGWYHKRYPGARF